ncbi:MAG: hypothetical protein DPW16_22660, partial [Chloroflexi bacterium]|nr:hypothetical protein [Chloroflexota bacterium]
MFSPIFRLRRLVLIGAIAALVSQLCGVASPTHSQEASPQRIESEDALVQQQGTWAVQASAQASGGTYLYSSGSPDDVLTLEFAGTAIEILYVAGPSLGTLAIEVDETVLRTVITTADSTAYQQITRIDYLTDETHTLQIYAQEGGIVGVDAFVLPAPTDNKPDVLAVNTAENETRATICSPTNAPHRVSLTSIGTEPNNDAYYAALSADGRYVAFDSEGPLMPGDGDTFNDIYVYDRQTCTLELISVSTAGVKGNGGSNTARLSADGRYVVFESAATNLVANDTNGVSDIFVRDRLNAVTTRVSVSSSGVESSGSSYNPDLSADGRLIVFESNGTNLVANDTNGQRDIFLHNRNTGNTVRVSLTYLSGQATGGASSAPDISADGRYIAFESEATNLVLTDTNGEQDIFVRDRQTNTTTRVSVVTGGANANAYSYHPAISNDGNLIAFASLADNLVPNDTNSSDDIFLHDRTTSTTTRISVATDGTQGDFYSVYPVMSDDGRYVVYESSSENLVAGDTNAESDIFVWDRTLNTTTRVSIGIGGVEGDDSSYDAAISADGRFIAFDSNANNLVPGDTNTFAEVYVTPLLQPADDSLALFNPPYNQVNLIDTLADTPPYTAYTAFSAY